LLLDEATAHLDLCHQWETLRLARKLADEGLAVIAVLHDLNQTMRFADLALVLDGGRLIRSGSPDQVLEAGLVGEVFGVAMAPVTAPDGVPALLPTGANRHRTLSRDNNLQRKD
jgi:iron complex transport system ATP-binding protein